MKSSKALGTGVAVLCVLLLRAEAADSGKRPVDYVNALVGTAPLDDPKLIGNAPPPGEELYTGITSPGAVLPHGVTNLSPINKNLDLSYPAGIGMSYNYTHSTMLGFSGPMPGLVIMPVVGDWTVPPERSASFYTKAKEKAGAGYYTVYLDDFRTKVELTASAQTGHVPLHLSALVSIAHRARSRSHRRNDRDSRRSHNQRRSPTRVSEGRHRAHLNARGTSIYFVAEFSKPSTGFWDVSSKSRQTEATESAAILSAKLHGPTQAIMRESIWTSTHGKVKKFS